MTLRSGASPAVVAGALLAGCGAGKGGTEVRLVKQHEHWQIAALGE